MQRIAKKKFCQINLGLRHFVTFSGSFTMSHISSYVTDKWVEGTDSILMVKMTVQVFIQANQIQIDGGHLDKELDKVTSPASS